MIIHEDKEILVVDKPAGVLVVPAPKEKGKTLTSIVNDLLRRRSPAEEARPCHRIDRETSGILLYAKTEASEREILRQFKEHSVKKRYIAFALGAPRRREGTIRGYVSKDPPYFGKGCHGGQMAVTNYRLAEQCEGWWVAEVEPVTGRTNQIRIHFRQIGHPILGDRKFSFGIRPAVKFPRVALHAERITFRHPATGNVVSFTSPLPPDMRDLLRR